VSASGRQEVIVADKPVYFTVHVTYRSPADVSASAGQDDFWEPFYRKLSERQQPDAKHKEPPIADTGVWHEVGKPAPPDEGKPPAPQPAPPAERGPPPGEKLNREIREKLGDHVRREVINFFAYIPLSKLEDLSFKVVSIKKGSLSIGFAAAGLGVILAASGFSQDALQEILAGLAKEALVKLLAEISKGTVEFIDGLFDVSIPELKAGQAQSVLPANISMARRADFVTLMTVIYSVFALFIVAAGLYFSHMERSEVLLYWKNLALRHEALERVQLERLIQRSISPVRPRASTPCHASARASCGGR
jgi:hypothetical protein